MRNDCQEGRRKTPSIPLILWFCFTLTPSTFENLSPGRLYSPPEGHNYPAAWHCCQLSQPWPEGTFKDNRIKKRIIEGKLCSNEHKLSRNSYPSVFLSCPLVNNKKEPNKICGSKPRFVSLFISETSIFNCLLFSDGDILLRLIIT